MNNKEPEQEQYGMVLENRIADRVVIDIPPSPPPPPRRWVRKTFKQNNRKKRR